MKLCKKCVETINGLVAGRGDFPAEYGKVPSEWLSIVSESNCEFWAHQAYNRIRMILKAGIEDMLKEIPP